jgi:hypothetical protein
VHRPLNQCRKLLKVLEDTPKRCAAEGFLMVSECIWWFLDVSGIFNLFISFHACFGSFTFFHDVSGRSLSISCARALQCHMLSGAVAAECGESAAASRWISGSCSSRQQQHDQKFKLRTKQFVLTCSIILSYFLPWSTFFFWFGEPKLYIGLRTRMLLACVEWFSMMASWSLYEPIFLEHVITW